MTTLHRPLPRLLVLTDRHQAAPRRLADVIERAVAGGATAVVLREKDLPRRDRLALADAIAPMVDVLVVATDHSIPADGVHLAAIDPTPDGYDGLRGRSCHDLAEVIAASDERCDYITVSPIHRSSSKPGYGPVLGVERLRDLVDATSTPVYALGGIDADAVAPCLQAGAYGVAVMGAVMRAPDPAKAVADLCAAIDREVGVR